MKKSKLHENGLLSYEPGKNRWRADLWYVLPSWYKKKKALSENAKALV